MIRIAVVASGERQHHGVKLVDTKGKDKLQAIAPVINEDQEEEEEDGIRRGRTRYRMIPPR